MIYLIDRVAFCGGLQSISIICSVLVLIKGIIFARLRPQISSSASDWMHEQILRGVVNLYDTHFAKSVHG